MLVSDVNQRKDNDPNNNILYISRAAYGSFSSLDLTSLHVFLGCTSCIIIQCQVMSAFHVRSSVDLIHIT